MTDYKSWGVNDLIKLFLNNSDDFDKIKKYLNPDLTDRNLSIQIDHRFDDNTNNWYSTIGKLCAIDRNTEDKQTDVFIYAITDKPSIRITGGLTYYRS